MIPIKGLESQIMFKSLVESNCKGMADFILFTARLLIFITTFSPYIQP